MIQEELRWLQEYDHWVRKTPSLVVAQWMREQRGEPPLQQVTPLDLYVLASPYISNSYHLCDALFYL